MQHELREQQLAQSGLWKGLHPGLALASLGIVIVVIVATLVDVQAMQDVFSASRAWIDARLDWYYIYFVCALFFLVVWLIFSKCGRVKLGQENDQPEFGRFSWFAMLFSASLSIGLLFWSIAEPIYHLQGNPFAESAGVDPGTPEAAKIAMRITLFHWGLHGWAIYMIVGLSLAYFSFRKGLPLSVRSALYPLIGDRIYGWPGHTVDMLAIIATLFGIATSLGLGASQMNAGVNYLFGWPVSAPNQVILIAVVQTLAVISVVSGIGKGIRILSEWNIRLSLLLILFFLIAGPTLYLLQFYLSSITDYALHAVQMGFWIDNDPERTWQGAWTLFYWGWWISWSPFVGIFIARISRGRTVREFIAGALLVPTVVGFLWLCIFGGAAMHIEVFGSGGVVEAVNEDITLAVYRTIELLNVDWATTWVAGLTTLLLVTWFVTSSDSGTLVLCTLLSMGDEHPPVNLRILWGFAIGAVAAALLYAGGLDALQSATIAAALPFTLVITLMAIALVKSLISGETNG